MNHSDDEKIVGESTTTGPEASARIGVAGDPDFLGALSRLHSGFNADAPRVEILARITDELMGYTNSTFGFIGEKNTVQEDSVSLSLSAVVCTEGSNEAQAYLERHAADAISFDTSKSVIATVIRLSKAITTISSDDHLSIGLPPGHPKLETAIVIPLLVGESTIGVVGIANRDGGYSESMAVATQALADAAAQMIHSHNERQMRFETVRALRESEGKYRDLVDNLTVGIYRFPLGGGPPLAANKVAAQIFGYENLEDFLSGFLWTDHFADPKDRDRLLGYLDRDGHVRSFQTRMTRRDGSVVWIELTVKLYWKLGYTEGAMIDISELKRAEEDRNNLESRLVHSQKLESLQVLAGGIAHDFNNLLMAISGNVELALLCGEFEDARSHVRAIRAATERASELASKILAFTGKRSFSWKHLDLSDVVTRSVHLFDASLHRKIFLDLGLQPHLPPVMADEDQICQVLVSLITNSAEAIGDQAGRITVSTSLVECSRELLASTYVDDHLVAGSYIRLQVMDNGGGLSEETRARMFEPFFTTKFVGRGLGLASTLGIVRGHDGAIAVEGETGCGCVVTIYLPISEEIPADADRADIDDMPWRGHGTVLLVDDEEMVRFVVGGLLRRLGFDVLGARNGREAIQVFQRNSNIIDLVLLDLQMPELDGVDTFFEIRKLRPEIQIILCSGYDEKTATEHLVGRGLAGFIQKPYTFANLKRMIRSVLGS